MIYDRPFHLIDSSTNDPQSQHERELASYSTTTSEGGDCPTCGATWKPNDDGSQSLFHSLECRYLAMLDQEWWFDIWAATYCAFERDYDQAIAAWREHNPHQELRACDGGLAWVRR